jgi:hypothetical protein
MAEIQKLHLIKKIKHTRNANYSDKHISSPLFLSNYHKLSALNNRNLLSCSSVDEKLSTGVNGLRVRFQQGCWHLL